MSTHDDSVIGLRQDIQELAESFKALEASIKPVLEAYNSVLFGKKFLIGVATVIGSFAAIGGAVIWLFNYIKHG